MGFCEYKLRPGVRGRRHYGSGATVPFNNIAARRIERARSAARAVLINDDGDTQEAIGQRRRGRQRQRRIAG